MHPTAAAIIGQTNFGNINISDVIGIKAHSGIENPATPHEGPMSICGECFRYFGSARPGRKSKLFFNPCGHFQEFFLLTGLCTNLDSQWQAMTIQAGWHSD